MRKPVVVLLLGVLARVRFSLIGSPPVPNYTRFSDRLLAISHLTKIEREMPTFCRKSVQTSSSLLIYGSKAKFVQNFSPRLFRLELLHLTGQIRIPAVK
jgi:hypothetical protein